MKDISDNNKIVKSDYVGIETVFAILYPPFAYVFITMIVQCVFEIINIVSSFKKVNKGIYRNAEMVYRLFNDMWNDVDKYAYLITFISALAAIMFFLSKYVKDKRKSHINDKNYDYTLNGIMKNEYRQAHLSRYSILYLTGFSICLNMGLSRLISLLTFTNVIKTYNDTQSNLLTGNIVIQLISLGIIVPMAEELIYRGLVLERIRKVIDDKVSVVMSALIFAIFHFSFLQGIYAFVIGLILCYVYIRYESIILCVIIHGIANLSAVLMNYTGLSKMININIFIYVLVMCFEIAGTYVLFDKYVKNMSKYSK